MKLLPNGKHRKEWVKRIKALRSHRTNELLLYDILAFTLCLLEIRYVYSSYFLQTLSFVQSHLITMRVVFNQIFNFSMILL